MSRSGKPRRRLSTLLAAVAVVTLWAAPPRALATARSQEREPGVEDDSATTPTEPERLDELEWPRSRQLDGHELVFYEPQVRSWKDRRRIEGVCAIALTSKGAEGPVFGALEFSMETTVDVDERLVLLENRQLSSLRFPGADESEARELTGIVERFLAAERSWIVPLDLIAATLEEDDSADVELNIEPPPIFYSERPAILVVFFGEPRFEEIAGTSLSFAVNTNWPVFLDRDESRAFLLDGESWLTARDPEKGPWIPAGGLPGDLAKLPDEEQWADVRENVPGKPIRQGPRVFVATEPAELIVTEGKPEYEVIAGSDLLWVKNTEADVFLHMRTNEHYSLIAGRWFASKALDGPWRAATGELPEEFAAIPPDHEKASVLASVPGTIEAEASVVAATVPRKVEVDRSKAAVEVVYEGEPEFVVVEKAPTVYYAVNTPNDVFRVDSKYYCCHDGVWFESMAPTGPWKVCTLVPSVIYTIPSSSPKYHVTYVRVYDATPTTVVVGYTSGYTGIYVAHGCVMFGLGWAIAYHHYRHWHWCHYHYRPWYWSWGCRARYDYYSGRYYRAGRVYGPYGGAGWGASYNPATGTYRRGAYVYGPYGSRYARSAYDPSTGTWAASRGGSSIYGSWGQGVVRRGDEWARGGYRSSARGTVGGAATSGGARVIGGSNAQGDRGFVGRSGSGDVYVGKDGNIYRWDRDSGWQKRSDGGWTGAGGAGRPGTADRPIRPGAEGSRERPGVTRPGGTTRPRPADRPATTRPATRQAPAGLGRDQSARQRYGGSTTRSRPSGGSRTPSGAGGGARAGGGIRR